MQQKMFTDGADAHSKKRDVLKIATIYSAVIQPAVNLHVLTCPMLATLCFQGMSIAHLLCPFLSAWSVLILFVQNVSKRDENINAMPKQWWLAGRCEEKRLLG